MTQEAARTDSVALASALLLGPLEPDEAIASSPGDTYLTGILWPEGARIDASDAASEDESLVGVQANEDGDADSGVPGYRAIKPCSIGITFAADRHVAVSVSLGTTARYERAPAPDGQVVRGPRPWTRHELGYRLDIAPGDDATWRETSWQVDGASVEDPAVCLHIRRRIRGDQQVLTLTLINRREEREGQARDELCLFQSEIIATATQHDGSGAIRPRPATTGGAGDEDGLVSALLYRDAVEFAVGHGISAMWTADTAGRATQVRTTWMPVSSVRNMSPAGHADLRAFRTGFPKAFEAAWLGREAASAEILPALRAFAACYADWVQQNVTSQIAMFDGDLRAAAQINSNRCLQAARRIEAGIGVLERSPHAWRAFVLANVAMDRQSRFLSKGDRRRPLVWHPFQLAWILLVIPGLAESEDVDRDCVDLLWFPTGGGKTEAYLGLAAFEIFLRRLVDDGRRSRGGVDVLMRYTLRLLTVQQFQRAAALISACDAIRLERGDLGAAPITIGLYVGNDATPNKVEDARTALAQERTGQAPRSTPRQLLNCPVCGDDLPVSCYSMPANANVLEIRCRNAACETHGRSLPVVVIDEIMYASPPSLLIGTIDKFAQLPRQERLGTLFGLDGRAPPGLIIQDELHLISGPLGSMAGLYETVVDLLCTRDGRRPKVIGSTATIGQAARQVRALFDRTVLQFPPPGIDASDSFFAVRDLLGPDRLYVGISSAGRSPKFALQAVTAAFLQQAAASIERGGDPADLDPFWTCVLYFNSLRELGGAHVLMQDDVPRQMEFLARRLDVSRRLLENEPVELSSRVPSRQLPEQLKRLDSALGGIDPYAPQPEDVVLASNMISVGVDIPRLGLMIVNGQPKSTAEYIQASSRVGRGRPGLVITIHNFGRPRDVSHFEHFCGYHSALYKSVEATSVTPWAPRARDKALHAVIAAAIRHLVDDMSEDADARDLDATNARVIELIDAILRRSDSASAGIEAADSAADILAIVHEWTQRSSDAQGSGTQLIYWKKGGGASFRSPPHLMTSAEEGTRPTALAWPTPNSMREVEPSTAFALKRDDRS